MRLSFQSETGCGKTEAKVREGGTAFQGPYLPLAKITNPKRVCEDRETAGPTTPLRFIPLGTLLSFTQKPSIFRSLEGQCMECGSRSAAATKKKKTIEMIPFMVKNAALRRRRSVGEMMRCS